MSPSVASLLLIALVAVAAPLVSALIGRVIRIPLVVFEIVLGILVGPSVLGWVVENDFSQTLSEIGLAMLFFMAGNEIDFSAIKGRPVRRASLGWAISIAAGIGLGVLLAPDPVAGVFIGIALSSTALGTILPILRDANEMSTPFGRAITAIGAVGEFGPLVAISIFLSGRSPGPSALILLVFVLIAGGAIWLAARGRHTALHGLVSATLHTSGQFAVRLVIFMVAALVTLSLVFGLDMLLGAFAAGVLWHVIVSTASPHDREAVEHKLDAVAFGFLVPVFFVYTGVTFDLHLLLSDATALALVPLFLALLLIVRGLPGLLAAPPESTKSARGAIILFGATGLPIIVAVTGIGTDSGLLGDATGTALVGAGMLSVLLFPPVALIVRARGVARILPNGAEP